MISPRRRRPCSLAGAGRSEHYLHYGRGCGRAAPVDDDHHLHHRLRVPPSTPPRQLPGGAPGRPDGSVIADFWSASSSPWRCLHAPAKRSNGPEPSPAARAPVGPRSRDRRRGSTPISPGACHQRSRVGQCWRAGSAIGAWRWPGEETGGCGIIACPGGAYLWPGRNGMPISSTSCALGGRPPAGKMPDIHRPRDFETDAKPRPGPQPPEYGSRLPWHELAAGRRPRRSPALLKFRRQPGPAA